MNMQLGSRFCFGLFGLSLAMASGATAAGVLFDKTINWTPVGNASNSEAHRCETAAYSITGPGVFKVRETMDPNRGREFHNKIEGVFKWTTHEGWEETLKEFKVGGKVVPKRGPAGAAIENRFEYRVPARKFSGELAICPPVKCSLSDCSRLAALTSLRIEFSGGGTATPTGSPQPPASGSGKQTGTPGPVGAWSLVANSFPGKIEIGAGSPPSVRLYYDVAGKWETMTNVRFDPGTGEIFFTRPWKNNPNFQQYRGKLSGNTFAGSFTDSNSAGKSFPWKAERR